MNGAELSWIHRYAAGTNGTTILLLHGTGGDENSLFDFGRELAPTANRLAVRGRSLEEGAPRFFRRFSATKYDQAHLIQEADALATFVSEAASCYGFDAGRVIALGFSNGANIGLASLAANPSSYQGALLLRPVMALERPPSVDLGGKEILVLSGKHDPFLPLAKAVSPYLTSMKANVQEEILNAGHELTPEDLDLSARWLSKQRYA